MLSETGYKALQVAFFSERKVNNEEHRAMLLTRTLTGWEDLYSLPNKWSQLSDDQHRAILMSCGRIARMLHTRGQVRGYFYPKHIFLQATGSGYSAQLIDPENAHPLLFVRSDRIKDLDTLLRRAPQWSEYPGTATNCSLFG